MNIHACLNASCLRLAASLVIAALAMTPSATGTTVKPPEFADLVNQSDYIVRAVVKSVICEYATPGSRKIVTLVELEVKEVVAGTPPQPLVLRMMGGKIGDEEMILEGAPQFKVGEESILFVQGNGRQIYPLVAMMHGLYAIRRETDGSEIVTRSNHQPLHDTAEVALPLTSGGVAELQGRLRGKAAALTPDEFVQQIRGAVKSTNARLRER
jgi:hypothetical protein